MSNPVAPPSGSPPDRVYPTLTPSQLGRIATIGRRRLVAEGEVLVHPGEKAARVFVVLAGRIEVVHPSPAKDVVVSIGPGMFTGEATMLSGRRGLATIRGGEQSEVIEVARDDILSLIQRDAELGPVFMHEFIQRRVELMARDVSNLFLLGSADCRGTLRVREFLMRNGHPYTMLDLDHDAGTRELLDRFGCTPADLPVVIRGEKLVLRNPSNRQVANALGFNDGIDQERVRDIIIVGSRACWPGRCGVRRFRGPGRFDRGVDGAGRTGRRELRDRELSWLSDGDRRCGARLTRDQPGAEVWRPVDDRKRRPTNRRRRRTVPARDGGRTVLCMPAR